MKARSVVREAREIELAIELIELGARLQLLEAETKLSRERLLKLYKEVKGASPPKGMLPFSADWFLSWRPNIHASLFVDIHRYLVRHTDLRGIGALIKAYRLYLEHVGANGLEPVLSLTRAWTLLRFLGVFLETTACSDCGGHYLVHKLELNADYVCGLCQPPSRAGKGAGSHAPAAAG
ncbi:MAG: flagellar transcriptional regulator FlhC [Betaproteobacteria bacterium]|nr:flagellar transcriptional regulator FlhC [Betaproteobacteria bacterium]